MSILPDHILPYSALLILISFSRVKMIDSCFWSRVTTGKCPMFNTLRPRQNGRRFADDTFERIFLNEKVRILIKISLKLVPKGPINNNPALVQIMAWGRPGDMPLSEPMMVCLLTHICVTRPQWVKPKLYGSFWWFNGACHPVLFQHML